MKPVERGARRQARLRVGIDFHTFDGIYQGSRSHLLGLYREVIAQAPDVDFVFFLSGPDNLRIEHPEFVRSNVELVGMPRRPGMWRLLWQLPYLQRRHRVDLLHVQYRLPFVTAGPCMCTLHDVLFESHPQFFSKFFASLARRTARRAVHRSLIVLTVSNYSREQIARYYAVDAHRIVVTPNAVDRRFFPVDADDHGLERRGVERWSLERWSLESGAYICMLGRLEPRKNHLALLHAYARLEADAPPLVIIGQRDFAYASIFEAIQKLRLSARVRILENVVDAELPTLLRHARLMVYPSHAEGFGMPVLEALASGIPVISSDTTSLPEVAGSAAWLVGPSDEDRLVEAMREALTEPAAARSLRIERGLQHASRFNWGNSAATLLDAVRSVAKAGQ